MTVTWAFSSTCSLHLTTLGRGKGREKGHLENDYYTHLGEGLGKSMGNYHFRGDARFKLGRTSIPQRVSEMKE